MAYITELIKNRLPLEIKRSLAGCILFFCEIWSHYSSPSNIGYLMEVLKSEDSRPMRCLKSSICSRHSGQGDLHSFRWPSGVNQDHHRSSSPKVHLWETSLPLITENLASHTAVFCYKAASTKVYVENDVTWSWMCWGELKLNTSTSSKKSLASSKKRNLWTWSMSR